MTIANQETEAARGQQVKSVVVVVVVVVEENDGGWMTSRGTIRESSKQKNGGKYQSDSDFSVALPLLYQKNRRFAAICDPPLRRAPPYARHGEWRGPESTPVLIDCSSSSLRGGKRKTTYRAPLWLHPRTAVEKTEQNRPGVHMHDATSFFI